MKIRYFLFLFILSFTYCTSSKKEASTQGLLTDHAMVVSAHVLASKAGKKVLLQGGNAFDAAVATHFVLAVVYPQAGNIGGGGFAVFRLNNGDCGTLDFREKAPIAASQNMYLNEDGEVLKNKSLIGHLAIGVPGSVDGMFKLHEKYGTLSWSDLIQPAIELAQQGHAINTDLSRELNKYDSLITVVNQRKTSYSKLTSWAPGDTLININLAQTLKQISLHGRAGFYEGIVADQIVNESKKGHGIISKEDLKIYQSKWRKPLIGSYKNHLIVTMPPPSAGGVALLQMLRGAEGFNFEKSGYQSTSTMHKMIEIERRVYADRSTYLADPDFIKIPINKLISSDYNQQKFSTIHPEKATPSTEIREGQVEVIESMETTHFSILDDKGNAVAVTTTLNSYFGSKVVVQEAGFFLNNEMDDFSAKPGAPNQFGLVSSLVNGIEPEKRMLSSMTPTLVLKNDQVKMILGTPGGSTIITSVYQAILNVIDHKMTMQEAVNAPKFHSQWLPDKVYFEANKFNSVLLDSLHQMGHRIAFREAIGKLQCILVTESGKIEGAPDYTRVESAAAGF